MNKEETFFISVLADHLQQKKTEPQEGLDWHTLLYLAQIHQVEGIVYFQCKNFIPDDIMLHFKRIYFASICNFANYKSEMGKIENAFHDYGIEMFCVKGLEIASYYPYPALRTMGDIDIVVRENKRKEADEILKQFQYTGFSHREDKEWEYRKQNMMIELHDHLVYDQIINKDEIERFFSDCWSFFGEGKLDVSFHFLFVLEHLRKHLLNSGAGFRQFMDVAEMSVKEKSLNWKWINEKLSELGLKEFSSVCAAFIEKWFGIIIPIKSVVVDKDFFEEATGKILRNGVFGFSNAENKANAAVNAARNSNIHSVGMVKEALRYVFPSYHDLSDKKFYPYLVGRPYLLPISWGHRFVRGIWNFRRVRTKMKLKFASGETIKKRDDYLKKWNL